MQTFSTQCGFTPIYIHVLRIIKLRYISNANLRCISIREVALANYAESFHECDFFLQKMLMDFRCTSTGNEILTLTDLDENFI